MKIRYGVSPLFLPKLFYKFGPKLWWGAIGVHFSWRKLEIEWDRR